MFFTFTVFIPKTSVLNTANNHNFGLLLIANVFITDNYQLHLHNDHSH